MSFSPVKVGDYVTITKETPEIKADNNYKGSLRKNMITTASVVDPFDTRCHIKTHFDGELGASWIGKDHFERLEPMTFEEFELGNYSHLLCVKSDTRWFTEGKYYPIDDDLTVADNDDDDWNEGDNISSGLKFVGVTQEQYNATHGIPEPALVVETPMPMAEVIPFPTPIRTAFKDMSDAERGALLLAHHEGKEIQCWQTGNGNGAINTWWTVPSHRVNFEGHAAYRVKPQALIDAENALSAAKSEEAVFLVMLDEKRRELQALEEKAATHSDNVAKAKDTVDTLLAA